MVDTEVEEALARHAALPAAARVVGDQLLRRREAKVPLKLQQRLSELFGVLLLGGNAPAGLLRYQTLLR